MFKYSAHPRPLNSLPLGGGLGRGLKTSEQRFAKCTSPSRSLATALRLFARALHSDRGSAAVPFILALPIFLWVVAILVQYTLIVNAKLLIDHAAQSAARAAVTSLPEGHPENVRAAAYLSLTTLSPVATSPVSPQADAVYQAMQISGIPVADSFPARYAYAMDATQVNWKAQNPQIDFTTSPGCQTDVTVTYRLCLTVPGAMGLIGSADTVAGIKGRFLNIVSTSRVETSHSRQTASSGGGWPQ